MASFFFPHPIPHPPCLSPSQQRDLTGGAEEGEERPATSDGPAGSSGEARAASSGGSTAGGAANGGGAGAGGSAGPCRRVHAWVLVMAGKRDVTEPIFIEPSTARR